MIIQGDARQIPLPDGIVQCVVTSPPYWNLRSYLPDGHRDKGREIGQEPTPDAYVQTLVEVFREVRRVLRPDGVCFLNLADSYAAGGNNSGSTPEQLTPKQRSNAGCRYERRTAPLGFKPKDLCLIPWRVAVALQGDGWWVRSVIAWAKTSCMPESVTDRPTNSWEPIFILTKSERYFYDAEAVKTPSLEPGRIRSMTDRIGGISHEARGQHSEGGHITGRVTSNQRNVWVLGPEPYQGAHFATFPSEIPRRAILAGTSQHGCCPHCGAPWVRVVEKGQPFRIRQGSDVSGAAKQEAATGGHGETSIFKTGAKVPRETVGWIPSCGCGVPEADRMPCLVLDPFLGSGTTGQVAEQLGRRWVGLDLAYHGLSRRRTRQRGLRL